MPSPVTHDLIAKQAVSLLPNMYYSLPTAAPDYYFIGSQGGDFLFFYKPLSRKEPNFGKVLHRRGVYDYFCAMRDYLAERNGDALVKARAYCLGYITHYSADAVFHPFVYNLLACNDRQKREHIQIENDWDVYFLRSQKNREVERYPFLFDPEKLIEENVLFPLLNAVAVALGRRELQKNAFARALRRYEKYLKFFHGNCYRRARVLDKMKMKKLSRFFPRKDPDPGVLSREDFSELAEGRGANADELFCRAVSDSARRMILFLAALDGAPLPREEFNFHLLSGTRLDLEPQ